VPHYRYYNTKATGYHGKKGGRGINLPPFPIGGGVGERRRNPTPNLVYQPI